MALRNPNPRRQATIDATQETLQVIYDREKKNFVDAAIKAGFTAKQADFMYQWFALNGHKHRYQPPPRF